jgi:hypothetical protein
MDDVLALPGAPMTLSVAPREPEDQRDDQERRPQRALTQVIEAVGVFLLPVTIAFYLLLLSAVETFYEVFGLTMDQAGINQAVLLGRMAKVFLGAVQNVVLYGSPALVLVWLVHLTTGRRLGRGLLACWRYRFGPPFVLAFLYSGVLVQFLVDEEGATFDTHGQAPSTLLGASMVAFLTMAALVALAWGLGRIANAMTRRRLTRCVRRLWSRGGGRPILVVLGDLLVVVLLCWRSGALSSSTRRPRSASWP